MPLASFDEALAFAGDGPKSVLLGNGFSMAYDSNSFKYYVFVKMLREDAACAQLVNVFDTLGTDDFEHVMAALNSSATVAGIYDCNCEELRNIKADENRLKEKLISFIADKHPEKATYIADAKYQATRQFLSKFDSYFTTNYDLLLYWALVREQVGGPGVDCNDGFGGQFPADLTWIRPDDQNVYYLHGAMHLFRSNGVTTKLRYNGNAVLRDQVQGSINQGRYPLFVSGRSAQEKREKIETSSYLCHCFKKFSSLEGTIFVHGHSLDDNDDHLVSAIKGNQRITHLCVSIFGDENSDENVGIRNKAATLCAGDKLRIYSAESANLWTE